LDETGMDVLPAYLLQAIQATEVFLWRMSAGPGVI
jgi:hypothetical protein